MTEHYVQQELKVLLSPVLFCVYVCVGFVTMCAKNVLTAGIFTIKLTASFVAPLFPATDQNKPDLLYEMSRVTSLCQIFTIPA